jgi:hypothetical protein
MTIVSCRTQIELSRSIEYFYKNAIDISSADDPNGGTKLMMAAAALIHDHNDKQTS